VKEWIAERRLLVARKGTDSRKELLIRIGRPYIVEPASVNFDVDDDTAGCSVAIVGLDNEFQEEVYGADLLQALQLAANVDPLLESFRKKYDFFFPTGEPYFEEAESE
jgi:hypothetical protein